MSSLYHPALIRVRGQLLKRERIKLELKGPSPV